MKKIGKYMLGGFMTGTGAIMMAISYLEGMNDKTAIVFLFGFFIAALGIPVWIIIAAITYFFQKNTRK